MNCANFEHLTLIHICNQLLFSLTVHITLDYKTAQVRTKT